MLLDNGTGYVDRDTEYLTPLGWKKISEYSGEKIATYYNDGTISFETPTKHVYGETNSWYILKHERGLDIKVSPHHNIVYRTSCGNVSVKSIEDVYKTHVETLTGFKGRLFCTFNTRSTYELPVSDDKLRLYVAIQADGSERKQKDKYKISVKKLRKINRVKYLLEACNISYHTYYGKVGTAMEDYCEYVFYVDGAHKVFPNEWYNLSSRQLSVIAEEANLWDGCPVNDRNVLRYASMIKSNADFIQFANTVATGYKTSVHEIKTNRDTICHTVVGTHTPVITALKRSHGITRDNIIQKVYSDHVEVGYTFKTNTGMWVMRRNNNIYITGE